MTTNQLQTSFPNFTAIHHQVQTTLNYNFQDADILKEALWASGPALLGTRQVNQNNARLALLGDGAMKTALMRYRYNQGWTKGQIQQRAQQTLDNVNLNVVGRQFGLHQFVVLNPGTIEVSGRTMATTVEALLGTIFEDTGMDMNVVTTVMPRLNLI